MSDNWQVGDLAQCVKRVDKRFADGLEVGRIYTVTHVTFGGAGLHLKELPSICPNCGSHDFCRSWNSILFRKIQPPKKESERFDFRSLLEPSKTKELEPA